MTLDERIAWAKKQRNIAYKKDSVQGIVYWDGYLDALKAVKDNPIADVVEVDGLLEYCKKCADTAQGLADKILENIGHGESEISALGGCSYFLQQARLYRFEIPNLVKAYMEESKNEKL